MQNNSNVYDDALERMRNERREELAQLNHITRERTAQFMHRCRKLQDFLSNNSEQAVGHGGVVSTSQNEATIVDNDDNDSVSSDETEETNEPPAILVEIRALVERRPVSSILNGAIFRRQLEEVFNNVPTMENISLLTPSRTTATNANATATPTATATATPTATTTTAATPSTTNNSRNDILRSILQNRRSAWQQELNSLLERGIVSHIINSGFEAQLAHLMTNGRGRPNQNDFLAQLDEALSDDSISIISASAQAVPQSHTTSGLVKEVSSLRKEMNKMKSMITMILDCQMETNRCINQVMAPFLKEDSKARDAQKVTEKYKIAENRGDCLICLDNAADTMVYRCGHLCMCHRCALLLPRQMPDSKTCPVCRAPIVDLVRVYEHGQSSSQ